MNESARKSILNISFLLPLHIVQMALNFIVRTFFIRILGSDYLGINVLFGDIITLLSLTELGLNSAITFALYRPLKLRDEKRVSEIINYTDYIFKIISALILGIGLLITPLLKYFVNTNINFNNVIFYYILYVITVTITYLATAKSTLIAADEKNYVVKIYYTVANTIKGILELIALIKFHSFTLFLIAGIITNVIYNIIITAKAKKDYPFISKKERLGKEERREIFRNTKAVFKYKLSTLILNNTDNIIISSLLSTVAVGRYSGYATLSTTMIALMNNFQSGIVHSIGKLNTVEGEKQKYRTFNYIHYIFYMIAGVTALCFFLLADDFIYIWIGNEYVLDSKILFAIVFNFYVTMISHPVDIYRGTTKLFTKTQNMILVTSLTNIVASVFFGKYLGLFGVLIVTPISRLLTCFWFEPYMLFTRYFDCKMKDFIDYIKKIGIEVIWVVIVGFILYPLMKWITVSGWIDWAIKALICFLCSFLMIFVPMLSTRETRKLVKYALKFR